MTQWRQVSERGVDHAFGVPALHPEQSPCGKTAPRQMELPGLPERPASARCKKCQFALKPKLVKPKKPKKAKGNDA